MEILGEVGEPAWSEFVKATPGFNLFQSPAMFRVLRDAKGYRPRMLAAEERGELRSLLVSYLVTHAPIRPRRFATRAIVHGGPIGEPRFFHALLAAHDKWAQPKAIQAQIRNIRTGVAIGPISEAGYHWEDHLNYLVDLRRGADALLGAMSGGRRKNIRKADRAGLRLVRLQQRDVARLYRLLSQTYRRAGVPLADISLFSSAFKHLSVPAPLLAVGAEFQGELCAARVELRWGSDLYDWYAGSSDVGRGISADEWLVWQVLQEGAASGCELFDFGGAGNPREAYGPREFKRRFGGEPVNPGRFEKVYHPVALRASKSAYDLWRRWH